MKKWFEDIIISRKIRDGFLVIASITVLVGLVGVISLLVNFKNQTDTYNECTLGIEYSSKANAEFLNLRAYIRDLYIYFDTDKETYIDKVESQLETVQTRIDEYGKTVSDSEDQANFDALEVAYAALREDLEKTVQAAGADMTSAELLATIKNGASFILSTQAAFDAIIEYNETLAAERLASDKTTTLIVIALIIVIIIVSYITTVLLSKYISGVIAYPLTRLAVVGSRLAVGDVDIYGLIDEKDRLVKFRKDEIGTLADSFFKIIGGTIKLSQETAAIAEGDLTTTVTIRSEKDVLGNALTKLVNDFSTLASSIISSAEQVDSGAKMVANSSMSLSQGATEQASSIEELSASIMSVSENIKKNAEDADLATKLSEKSSAIMKNSVNDMELARQAMDEISTTSKDIGKVIKAIDDIAFQTNILALNAAVEAARAGAAGKGFAVVADEVRNLSQKSAEAAKNTTVLIESSIGAVEKGTELVKKTSAGFSEVAAQSNEVNRLVELIAAQAQEQATAVSQISIGIEQVSSVVQMNSATSEEVAAASEELSSQSNCLKESASKFQL
ncbi:MAG: MCP four helix bundle domain-containing protein [Oscillospiraceae bacterium]|nr:MCP four helix bundle domain-containing protein [Oscillospiraceae bacterium]